MKKKLLNNAAKEKSFILFVSTYRHKWIKNTKTCIVLYTNNKPLLHSLKSKLINSKKRKQKFHLKKKKQQESITRIQIFKL